MKRYSVRIVCFITALMVAASALAVPAYADNLEEVQEELYEWLTEYYEFAWGLLPGNSSVKKSAHEFRGSISEVIEAKTNIPVQYVGGNTLFETLGSSAIRIGDYRFGSYSEGEILDGRVMGSYKAYLKPLSTYERQKAYYKIFSFFVFKDDLYVGMQETFKAYLSANDEMFSFIAAGVGFGVSNFEEFMAGNPFFRVRLEKNLNKFASNTILDYGYKNNPQQRYDVFGGTGQFYNVNKAIGTGNLTGSSFTAILGTNSISDITAYDGESGTFGYFIVTPDLFLYTGKSFEEYIKSLDPDDYFSVINPSQNTVAINLPDWLKDILKNLEDNDEVEISIDPSGKLIIKIIKPDPNNPDPNNPDPNNPDPNNPDPNNPDPNNPNNPGNNSDLLQKIYNAVTKLTTDINFHFNNLYNAILGLDRDNDNRLLDDIKNSINNQFDKLINAISKLDSDNDNSILGKINKKLDDIYKLLEKTLYFDPWIGFDKPISTIVNDILKNLKGDFDPLGFTVGGTLDWIKNFLMALNVQELASNVGEFFDGLFDDALDLFDTATDVVDTVTDVVNTGAGVVSAGTDVINSAANVISAAANVASATKDAMDIFKYIVQGINFVVLSARFGLYINMLKDKFPINEIENFGNFITTELSTLSSNSIPELKVTVPGSNEPVNILSLLVYFKPYQDQIHGLVIVAFYTIFVINLIPKITKAVRGF